MEAVALWVNRKLNKEFDLQMTGSQEVLFWYERTICVGAWSDAYNCSHEFFFALGQLREAGLPVVQHPVTRLAEVTFLHVNRMQKLPLGKSSLAHAHY